MSTDQMNIFGLTDNETEDLIEPGYLLVVLNNQKQQLTIEEIFDCSKYNEFYAISYVSSPSFFSKYTKGFEKVSFILGINDNANLEQFASGIALNAFIDMDSRISFWNGLADESKEQINNNRLDIRFGDTDVIIHDKIYLLKNEAASAYRVVIGSANFSNSAFAGKKQFENVRIDDDKTLFDLYMERFNEVYSKTLPYIPERCLRDYKQEKVVVVKTGEVLFETLMEDIAKNKTKLVVTEQHIEQIKEMGQEIVYKKTEINKTDDVLSLIVHKSKDKYDIKPLPQLTKLSVAIKTILCRTNKNTEKIDERIHFSFHDKDHVILKNKPETDEFEVLSKPMETETIKKNLTKINDFVEAYRIFAQNPVAENQSKVFEVLLYSFMSAYIWKMRQHFVLESGRESVRHDICPFMIIGGVAKSGKTTALEFASLLLGNNGKRYFKYTQEVAGAGVLVDLFHSSNLFPILVDEIEPSFFHKNNSPRKGEGFIRHVANDLAGTHPVLIGTTNKTDFSSSEAVIRRIYYLEINNRFDDHKKAESMEYLENIMQDTDDSLFRDFTYRMSNHIKNNDVFYKIDDILYRAREIFKDYYTECGMDIPAWFPNQIFEDYEVRKVSVWKNLFETYPNYFKDNGDTLFVYIDEICKNSKRNQRETLLNFLDDTCIKENNVVLELHKEKFYQFINYKNRLNIFQQIKNLIAPKKAANF